MAMKNKKSYCRNGFYNFSQGFNSPRLHHDKTAQNISFGRFFDVFAGKSPLFRMYKFRII